MSHPLRIRIGTRASELALRQTRWVAERLRAADPGVVIEEIQLSTAGDRDVATPLAAQGGIGVFTKELERALLANEIDLAVHSLKDLPTRLGDGLTIAAVPVRESPWDVWVSAEYPDLRDLPPGAVVLTGSPRRSAQIRHAYPALEVRGIRGNVDTRVAKYREMGGAGVVLAAAGLLRLGRRDLIRATFGPTEMTPSPGQGALGLETRADDERVRRAVALLDDAPSRAAVTAERALLARLGAGCHMPVGAIARVVGANLSIAGMVAMPDGSRLLRMGHDGAAKDSERVGTELAELLLDAGAADILAAIARAGPVPPPEAP